MIETTVRDAGTVLTYEIEDDERVSEVVVAAVATASNADPTKINPLADAVDPDALDALFADQYDGTPRTDGSTRFPFSGYEVLVASGLVSVHETPR